MRFKNRYLLCSFVFPASLPNPFTDSTAGADASPAPPQLSEGGLISLLRESLSINFGDVGAGEIGGAFSIKYLSPSTQIMILRVSREHLRTIWAALTLLRRVGGHEVLVRVLHVSGTIRKIQHSAMAHDRAAILASAKRKRLGRAMTASVEEPEAQIAESESKIMALEA